MVTVSDAENQCAMQGGRLWQPRSVEAYYNAFPKMETYHMGLHSQGNHYTDTVFGHSETAIGLRYIDGVLMYREGEPVPQQLLDVFDWDAGFPDLTDNTTNTCVTWFKMKLRNVPCDGKANLIGVRISLKVKSCYFRI